MPISEHEFRFRPGSNVVLPALIVFLFLLISGNFSIAQNPPEESTFSEQLPPEMPPLPSPRERSGGTLIFSDNIDSYATLLERPLLDWVKEKRVVFRAVRSLDHVWKLSDAWEKSAEQPWANLGLQGNGDLVLPAAAEGGEAPNRIGLPFGRKEALSKEQDPQLLAKKILWNMFFMRGSAEESRLLVDLTWIGSQILRRKASAVLYERYFLSLAPEQPFLSQWLLQFYQPANIQNYSLLAWNFRETSTPEEGAGRFWIFSPPIQRTRELHPANRSDGILGGTISADEIGVWSGDPRAFDAKVTEEKTVFVFFPSTRPYSLVQQGAESQAQEVPKTTTPQPSEPQPASTAALPPAAGAESSRSSLASPAGLSVSGLRERPLAAGSAAVVWNFESRQYPQLVPWFPVSVTAVPRKVWVLELNPRDPFYQTGRQRVFVDQELMLPVMTLSYDRLGELQKTTLGGWGLAEKKDRSVVMPFFAFQFSVSQSEAPVTALTTTAAKKLAGGDGQFMKKLRTMLQPESYGKAREKPTATPSPGAPVATKAPVTPPEEEPEKPEEEAVD